MEEKEIGLYIHMPFCKQKCYYCDFVSYPNRYEMVERYIKCLKSEIVQYANENRIMHEHGLEPKFIIKTIYIGGGTPSSIDEFYILNIMETIKVNFEIAEDAEITIEVNPGTASKEKLKAYREAGINRISIGLQAVQDRLLKSIGRIHNYSDFENTFEWAREAGFDNINVDLMLALPNQTLEDLKESVKTIVNLKPEHISVYSLIVEENTKMEKMVQEGTAILPTDEEERAMYWFVKDYLEKHKYKHYEISNFAKPGFESKHNTDCWKQKEYIGIGAAACSFMDNKRYSNIESLEQYIKNIENGNPNRNLMLNETLNEEDKMNEFMMLGLRMMCGVNTAEFEKRFGKSFDEVYGKTAARFEKLGLLECCGDFCRLTEKGIDVSNSVMCEFII